MTEKRFTILSSSIDYYEYWDTKEEKGLTKDEIVELLNTLHEENTQIKSTIKEAYENERTQIGKNVLKQLIEQME